LIFLWTVSMVTTGDKCSAMSFNSCVKCYTSKISFLASWWWCITELLGFGLPFLS
jgi:hypothetical protein